MFKKNSIASALILAAFALSASASAETYLGATVGQAKWNIDCTGAVSCKTADTAFKVLVGYELAPLWSLEASYFSLGEVGANDASVKGTFSARGIDLAGVVKTAPMKGLVGFAKMGVAYVRGETSARVGAFSGYDQKKSMQAVFGLGVTYKVSQDMTLRLEYERRNVKVSDIDNTTSTVSNFSVGAQSSF